MKQIDSKTRKLYKTYSYNIANLKFMKQVHNKAHKLYKTYSYNIANLNFMKQIHKIIKYTIYPNNSIKLVHVKLN